MPVEKHEYKLAVAALIIANVVWGAAPPIFKLALTNIPPFSLAFLRFSMATILLLPLLLKSKYWRVEKSDLLLLLQNGLYGVTFNISFFFLGLRLAPSINASVIASAASIFTTALAVIFIKEKPSRRVIAGSLVGFLGVVTIVGSPLAGRTVPTSLPETIGNIFFVLATLAAAAQTITSRELALKYSSRTFTFYTFLIGSLSFFPLAILEFLKDPLWPIAVNSWGLTGIAFGAFFSSFLAYTLWGYGTEKLNAAEVGLYMYLNPIVTVLIAVPLLGESLSLTFVVGSAFALLGIYLAEGRLPILPYHHKRKLEAKS